MLSFRQEWRKMLSFRQDFSPSKMEKNLVQMEKNTLMLYKKWIKSGIFSPKKVHGVVPGVPEDYVGHPTRLDKLVELLLKEEAFRTWEAGQEERDIFFLKNAADLGCTGLGGCWLQCTVLRCWILLEGLAT
jgi:hypothetical protein